MPDAGGRIKRSAIESMCGMLLSMTSLYANADPNKHPRICVVFNNVSKVHHAKKAAPKYGTNKQEDKEDKEAELDVKWDQYIPLYRDLLIEVLEENYKESLTKDFIVERIGKLFPDDNFYFYQMRDNEDEMILEWAQIEKFIEDNLIRPSFYIKSG